MASTGDPILVVGGGLGGASVALALARKGFRVCLLEQASEFGVIGYGIQLGPNAFYMFDRLGVSEAVLAQNDGRVLALKTLQSATCPSNLTSATKSVRRRHHAPSRASAPDIAYFELPARHADVL